MGLETFEIDSRKTNLHIVEVKKIGIPEGDIVISTDIELKLNNRHFGFNGHPSSDIQQHTMAETNNSFLLKPQDSNEKNSL